MAQPLAAEVVAAPDLDALSRLVAERVAATVTAAVATQGRCTVALSGGQTPLHLYRLLAGEYRHTAPWNRVEWFWGDERCVPPVHPESNYAAAWAALLGPLRVSSGMVHRIAGEQEPAVAAAAYDLVLRDRLTGGRFDLVLLGTGTDGHTASLFPGSAALDERERWAVAVTGGADLAVRQRVTLTLPVLDRARAVFILVAGGDKRAVLRRVFEGHATDPVARVHPEGALVWFVDAEADPRLAGAG